MNAFFIAARSSPLLITTRPSATLLHYRHLRIGTTTSSQSSETKFNAPDTASKAKAAEDAIAVEGTTVAIRSTLAAQCLQPRPIFPWRSSPDPLARLSRPARPYNVEDDTIEKNRGLVEYYKSDYFTKGGPLGPGWLGPLTPLSRGILYVISMRFLQLSWPSILMPWTRKDWEYDMVRNFCHAFSSGVNGMVKDTYRLAENEDNHSEDKDEQHEESESFDVNLDLTLDPLPLTETNVDKQFSSEMNKGEGLNDKKRLGIDEEEEYSMLQQDLRQLYQSARNHSQPSKVNIVLRTVPISAQIESLFPVLGLSRSLVNDHPNLRHTYRNLLKLLPQKNKDVHVEARKRINSIDIQSLTLTLTMDIINEIIESLAKLSGDGQAAITVVAQVSINCREMFCIRDVESGAIIQGYDDGQPRDVTHLVRFEMVVRAGLDNGFNGKFDLGRWQITDWDDLLDGNVFFT